jgi:tetratricopeptide (TPR) repeat protein
MDELGDPKAALPYAEQAVKLAPSNAGILDTVGWNHVLLKNYGQAIGWLRQAMQIDPGMPAVHLHAARALFERGSAAGAKDKTADFDAAKGEVLRAHQLASEQLARTGQDADGILPQTVELGDKLGVKLSGPPASAPAK